MTNPIVIERNLETGEVVEREMTADELKQLLADEKAAQDYYAIVEQKAAEKAALLAKLGITADEAKLLLS